MIRHGRIARKTCFTMVKYEGVDAGRLRCFMQGLGAGTESGLARKSKTQNTLD